MIDLTPLDVRKKRGDFPKALRGYDPQEVDTFLELAAERLEEVVKENMTLRERTERLGEQVTQQTGREKAVQDALVTAQQLREEMRTNAERESELVRREGEAEARRIIDDAQAQARATLEEAERLLRERTDALAELERRRTRFLTSFRQLLERELDVVHVEEGRSPLQDVPIDLELLGGVSGAHDAVRDGDGPMFELRTPGKSAADDPAPHPVEEAVPESEVELGAPETELETSVEGPIDPPSEPRDPAHPTGEGADDDSAPSREDLGFFENPSADEVSWEPVPENGTTLPSADADVHGMAAGVDDGAAAGDDEDWLDAILDDEASNADRRPGEGE